MVSTSVFVINNDCQLVEVIFNSCLELGLEFIEFSLLLQVHLLLLCQQLSLMDSDLLGQNMTLPSLMLSQ